MTAFGQHPLVPAFYANRASVTPRATHTQGEYPHRARTASAPRQVFEQLPSEMVYWERSCKWYLVGS